MEYGLMLGWLHQFVAWLLYPVVIALGLALLATLWEFGQVISERFIGLVAYQNQRSSRALCQHFETYAATRIERADLLARSGPILGLMGTLIPLGPGLTALGQGQIDILATALTVAFDTTVIGLFIGLIAYIIGRVRRRWYEHTWQLLQLATEHDKHSVSATRGPN